MRNFPLNSQKGESLIGVLAGVVLIVIAVLALGSSMLGVARTPQKITGPLASCREIARDTIAILRSNGAQSGSYWTPIDSNFGGVRLDDIDWHKGKTQFNRKPIRSEFGAISERGGARWPRKFALEGLDSHRAPYRSNTPLLIGGTMNALLSIYNSHRSEVCRGSTGLLLEQHPALRAIATANSRTLEPRLVDNKKVNTFLYIRPYDLNTGDRINCPDDLQIRPYARTEPPPAVKAGFFHPDFTKDYLANVGLEVEVRVALDVPKGEPEISCALKENFQYERRDDLLNAPEVELSVNNGRGVLRISAPPSKFGPGVHLLCRETHSFKDYDRTAKHTDELKALINRVNDITASTPLTPDTNDNWRPCNKLRVCKRDLDQPVVDHKARRITHRPRIPRKCITQIEAIAIDAVGNISDSATANHYSADDPNRPSSPADYRPSSSGGDRMGYEVAGRQFATQEAAQKAAAFTGMPVRTTAAITGKTYDIEMNRVARNVVSTENGRNATQVAATATASAASRSTMERVKGARALDALSNAPPGTLSRSATDSLVSEVSEAYAAAQQNLAEARSSHARTVASYSATVGAAGRVSTQSPALGAEIGITTDVAASLTAAAAEASLRESTVALRTAEMEAQRLAQMKRAAEKQSKK